MMAPVTGRSAAQSPSCPRLAPLLQMAEHGSSRSGGAMSSRVGMGRRWGTSRFQTKRLTVRAVAATLHPPLIRQKRLAPGENSENAGIPPSDSIILWGRPCRLSGIEAGTSRPRRGNSSATLNLEVHHSCTSKRVAEPVHDVAPLS